GCFDSASYYSFDTAFRLLQDLRDDACADGTAAFADGEAQLFFHRDRHDQFDLDRYVVARHHHLGAFGKLHDARHVRRAEVELRTIVREERRVTAAFVLRQDVGFRNEVRVRRDAAGFGKHLAAFHALAIHTTQERADVVAGLALVEQL